MSKEVRIAGESVESPVLPQKFDMHPKSTWAIAKFFEEKSSEDTEFAGYDECIASLINGLTVMTMVPEEQEIPLSVPLILKPAHELPDATDLDAMSDDDFLEYDKAADPATIYGNQEPHGTTALMWQAYEFTHAQLINDTRTYIETSGGDIIGGPGQVVMMGTYKDKPVIFIETYAHDRQVGDYMIWQLMSAIPRSLQPQPKPKGPYMKPTKREQIAMVDDMADIVALAGSTSLRAYFEERGDGPDCKQEAA